jgi:uncharacterized protein YqhQ
MNVYSLTIRNKRTPKNGSIDYEKLAKAIVEANAKAEQTQRDADAKKSKLTIGFFLFTISTSLLILSIALFCGIPLIVENFCLEKSFLDVVKNVAILMFSVGFPILCFFTYNNEIKKETDKRYLAALSSNTVCIMALVVAFFLLLREFKVF